MDIKTDRIVNDKSSERINKYVNSLYPELVAQSKKARIDEGISQKEIAKTLGINQDKISNYESGKVSPRLDLFVRYLDVMGYTIKIVKKGE